MPVINLTLVKKDRTPNNIAEQTTAPHAQVNEGQVAATSVNEGNLAIQKTNEGELIAADNEPTESVKEIRLEGPLSGIYSQALRIYYAKESVADGSQFNLTERGDEDGEGVDPDLYVYVNSSDSVTPDDGIAQFDTLRLALDKYTGTDRIVAFEMENANNAYAVVLEEYVTSRKERVYHKRHLALNAIIDFLK